MPASSMLARAKAVRGNAKLKVQSSRTLRKIKTVFGISSSREKGKAPEISGKVEDAGVPPQPTLLSESPSPSRTPDGARYYDEHQGPSSMAQMKFSIGGVSPPRGITDTPALDTPRDRIRRSYHPPRSRFTEHVDADNTYKCNIDDDESPPRVHASAISKSTTMTAGGKSPFPRFDSIDRSPPKSATMTGYGKTPFPRFLDMACGQHPRSNTLHPDSALTCATAAYVAPMAVATSSLQLGSDPFFGPGADGLTSTPRLADPPTPLRRVPARLNLSEGLRQSPFSSPTSPRSPGPLRRTGASTSPVVQPRDGASNSLDSMQELPEDEASEIIPTQVMKRSSTLNAAPSPVGNTYRRVSKVLVPMEAVAEDDEEFLWEKCLTRPPVQGNYMLFPTEPMVPNARVANLRSQTIQIPERKSSLPPSIAATYKPRKLSIQASFPPRLNEGAKRTPVIAAQDLLQLAAKAYPEKNVENALAKESKVPVPASREDSEEGFKKLPTKLTIKIPPTPSRIPRSSSAVVTGIPSPIQGSYRRVTDMSSNTIPHSLAKVMNAQPVTPARHPPIRIPTATKGSCNTTTAASGKSSISISLSMVGMLKSETTYASKDPPKHTNVWSCTRERLGLPIKAPKVDDVSGTVAEIPSGIPVLAAKNGLPRSVTASGIPVKSSTFTSRNVDNQAGSKSPALAPKIPAHSSKLPVPRSATGNSQYPQRLAMVSKLAVITPSMDPATVYQQSEMSPTLQIRYRKHRMPKEPAPARHSPTLASEGSDDKKADNPVLSRRTALTDGSVFSAPTEKTFMKLSPKDSGRRASGASAELAAGTLPADEKSDAEQLSSLTSSFDSERHGTIQLGTTPEVTECKKVDHIEIPAPSVLDRSPSPVAANIPALTPKPRSMGSQVFEPRTPETETIAQLAFALSELTLEDKNLQKPVGQNKTVPPVNRGAFSSMSGSSACTESSELSRATAATYTTYASSVDSNDEACESDFEVEVAAARVVCMGTPTLINTEDGSEAKVEDTMRATSNTLKIARVSTEVIRKNSVEAREEAAKTEKTVMMPCSYPSWMEPKEEVEEK
ncbi:hypothetical protein FPQ18DRAFT_308652 [Pyronema domesticum]|nr:hypothetical protein FPQ18DRAFT_308652 [Pyronema domesticum]